MTRSTILWPSRSLDAMNANKRKRTGDRLEAGSHGRGATVTEGSPEDGGDTEGQDGKRRRTGEPGGSTSQVAGHPGVGYQGLPKTPIPITNRAGTFKVPSPSDSDWSESGSEEDEGNNARSGDITPSRANNGGVVLGGPSRPFPTLRPAESEALRKAQENSQKHRPRKPSRLSHSTKAYSSPPSANKRQSPPPPPSNPGDAEKRQPQRQAAGKPSTTGPSGHSTKFTAFEDWCKTAPPAVTAAVEQMEFDSTMAGNAVEKALENRGTGRAIQHTAYEQWCRTASPAVTAVLDYMEVDSNIAGQAFMSGLDKFTEQK